MYVCLLYIQGERERDRSLFRVSMHFQPTNEFCGMLYSSKERIRKAGVLLNAGARPQFLWETSIQFYSIFSLQSGRCSLHLVYVCGLNQARGWHTARSSDGLFQISPRFRHKSNGLVNSKIAKTHQETRLDFILSTFQLPFPIINGKFRVSAPWNFHFPKKPPSTS